MNLLVHKSLASAIYVDKVASEEASVEIYVLLFIYPHDSTQSVNFVYCTMVRSHGANSDKQFLQIHTYSLITYFLTDFTMTYAV